MERFTYLNVSVIRIGVAGLLGIGGIALLLLVPGVVSAESCNKLAEVKQERALYDRPPYFETGHGWRFGQIVHHVDRGDKLWICRKKSIGFGFSTQLWYQVWVFWVSV